MSRRNLSLIAAFALPLLIGAGCSVWPSGSRLPWVAPNSCDYEGKTYSVGDARSAGDTCNTCVCGATGWSCSQNRCPKSDGKSPGQISGSLSFPSEIQPGLRVCAHAYMTEQQYCMQTNDDDKTYQLSVPEGSYWISSAQLGGKGVPAWYSQAVPCGLLATCLDHSPIRVKVASGQTTNADPTDWYARAIVTAMTVAPSKRVDGGNYYLDGAVINVETYGAEEVELFYVAYLNWLTERDDKPFLSLGKADRLSTEGEKQLWRFIIPPGFDAGRLWAVAKAEDGSIFTSPGLGWVRSDIVNQ